MNPHSIDTADEAEVPSTNSEAEQAGRLLALIERRTSQMVAQTWQALALLFDEAGNLGPDSLKTYNREVPSPEIRFRDLERHAPEWEALVPADPGSRAALAHALGQRHRFTRQDSPRTIEALGLDDERVQAAYRQQYGRGVSSIFDTHGEVEAPNRDLLDVPWLDASARKDIESELSRIHLLRGETLMRRGDPGDAVYILINGRLRVSTTDESGNDVLLSSLGAGAIVGEMAILTGDPRTATVKAARDSELVKLSRDGFNRLVEAHPRVLLHMVRVLARRLSQQSQRSAGTDVTTITVAPAGKGAPLTEFCTVLAEALARYGPTLRLDSKALEAAGVDAGEADHRASGGALTAWLNDKESNYRYVIYETDPDPSPWTSCCLRQADRLIVLLPDGAPPIRGDLEAQLLASEARDRELIIIHPDGGRPPTGTRRAVARWKPTRHHHVRMHSSHDVRRVARSLVGRAVGVVLGGGGVRCFAHIGALRALEEAGIPIDFLAGSSGGAVVGAQYAMGWSIDTILERNRELIKNRLMDYTFPLVSLLSARGIARALDEMFGEGQIEDLYLGFFSVSSDLVSAQIRTHSSGSLRRAVRASIALPGLLPPLADNGGLLVDGVVLNNMPVEAMQEFCQGGPVIAVDVSLQTDMVKEYEYGESLSGFHVLMNRLNPFSKSEIAVPGIFSILFRAMELHSERTQQDEIERAALYLNPPVASYSAFNPKPAEELVALGYEYTRNKVAEWSRTAELSAGTA